MASGHDHDRRRSGFRNRTSGSVLGVLALLVPSLTPAAAMASSPTAVLVTRDGTLLVTRNVGIFEMIGHADPIVKFVMLLLLIASITSWSIWLAKTLELTSAKRRLKKDYGRLYTAEDFAQTEPIEYPVIRGMVRTAQAELKRGGPTPSWHAVQGMEERVASLLLVLESEAMHRVLRWTNLLASIGAVAPFVGLAGTVWGIMNSFLGISKSQSTSLAVVAPGIAEALLATAFGLAAAIPAVLIYNSLSRAIAGYRRLLNSAAQLTLCVMSREAEKHYDRSDAGAADVGPHAADRRPVMQPVSGADPSVPMSRM